jgi:protein tyrosine/serine phosphatase
MKKNLIRGGLAIVAGPLVFLAYFCVLQLMGNFHEVIPGQLYRSKQPTAQQISSYVRDHGIKTIINLRGENENSGWYKRETAVSETLGVTHIDFGMSARKQLTMERVAALVQIMRNAPKPILIHCQSGADRTGLAAAIYASRVAGLDESTAESQLSIRFGHLGIPYFSSAYAMDLTWEDIEKMPVVTGIDTDNDTLI